MTVASTTDVVGVAEANREGAWIRGVRWAWPKGRTEKRCILSADAVRTLAITTTATHRYALSSANRIARADPFAREGKEITAKPARSNKPYVRWFWRPIVGLRFFDRFWKQKHDISWLLPVRRLRERGSSILPSNQIWFLTDISKKRIRCCDTSYRQQEMWQEKKKVSYRLPHVLFLSNVSITSTL